MLAYEAIESVLSESEFLKQFVANPHERVGFVQIRGKTVSQIAGRGNNATSASKVAIAAGTVSFLLAAIFLGGIFRKKRREKKARMRKQLEPGKGKRFLLGSAPRKYYELDEEQENACGFKVLDLGPGEPYYENPSTTWSISDITSESGSILSNLSRTTSKLERIEEVEEECPTDEEWDGTDTDDHINSIPAEYLYDMSSPRHHVGQFDAGIEDPADPEGCRYLDDSSRASSSSNDMDDEIEMIGLSGIDDYLLECSDDSDDEGGTLEEDLMGLSAMEKYLIPELDSLSNSSAEDEGEQEKQQEQSRAMVLHESAWEWDEISDASASQWMVELLKELRKSQRRKLLTYGTEEHGSTAT